jgi:hypothetical protein
VSLWKFCRRFDQPAKPACVHPFATLRARYHGTYDNRFVDGGAQPVWVVVLYDRQRVDFIGALPPRENT